VVTLAEIGGGELDHLVDSDKQHGGVGHIGSAFPKEVDGGAGDRAGPAAHFGVGADLLGDAEGLVKQAVHHLAGSLDVAGGGIGFLELADDLVFAKHHRIQTGGHAEDVGGDVTTLADIEAVPKGHQVEVTETAIERYEALKRIELSAEDGVEFDAVAGRDDDGLVDTGLVGPDTERGRDILDTELHRLSLFERGGFVVDPAEDQLPGCNGHQVLPCQFLVCLGQSAPSAPPPRIHTSSKPLCLRRRAA